MALKIIKESDPVCVTQISVCIHGGPGTGKTTAGNTAESPIVLDFDNGSHRSGGRKDVWQFDKWEDVCLLTRADFEPYKTVVVDTAGRALEMLALDIMEQDPKAGRGGQLSIQGYGVLKSQFTAWMNLLKSYKKDIILICHSDEKQRGEEVIERLDVVGGSKNEIYKTCDVMGRLAVRNGKRTLNCNPDEAAFGKNPAGLPIVEVPEVSKDPKFMANLIQKVKDAINTETEAQKPAIEFMNKWKSKIDGAITVEDYNAIRKELVAETCASQIRTMLGKSLTDKAKSSGISYNAKDKIYEKVS